MGVIIDQSKCARCGRCSDICPGNLIRKDGDKKAYLKRPGDCWSCVSCVKECPVGAIALILPPELGGSGGRLTLTQDGSVTRWVAESARGVQTVIVTDTKEANKY